MLARSAARRRTRGGPRRTIPAPENGIRLRVSPHEILLTLVALAAALICASLAVQLIKHSTAYPVPWNLERVFDLEGENSLPTYFSSVNLLACGVLLSFIHRGKAASGDRYARYWAGLGLVFLYLSVDEAASLHEASVGPLQRMLGATGALYAAWVVPGGLAVAAFGLLYLRFLLALPRPTRRLFVLAAGLYVGGAIGLEMLGWHHRFPLHRRDPTDWEASRDLTYKLFTTGEEGLEMAGVIVFLYALLSYLAAGGSTVTVCFGARPPADAARSADA